MTAPHTQCQPASATLTGHGPCVICGDTGYGLSCGGPSICPKCDCGNFDAATVMKQAKVIATLQARVDELTKALKATREQLIKVRDASPEIRNHELETNQVIAHAWHTLNDTGVAMPLEDRK